MLGDGMLEVREFEKSSIVAVRQKIKLSCHYLAFIKMYSAVIAFTILLNTTRKLQIILIK